MKGEKNATIKVPRFEAHSGFNASEKSSRVMSKISSQDTKVETKLRKALWMLGYRYRLHKKNMVGKPDIIFASKMVAIFVDGDFWHGYNWEQKKVKLATNKAYWIPKIERNMQRDAETTAILVAQGWKVIRLWEHDINQNIGNCINMISTALNKLD